MDQNGSISHFAMSIERAQFTDQWIEALQFYSELLDWHIDKQLSIPNERLLIRLPSQGQYLNVRAADSAMTTTAYEHLGIYVKSAAVVKTLYEQVVAQEKCDGRVEIDERGVQVLYGGALTTFRFKYLLPVAIEIQHLAESSAHQGS